MRLGQQGTSVAERLRSGWSCTWAQRADWASSRVSRSAKCAWDQGVVGQRPQVLGRLQLRGVGRQEEQMDVLGHAQVHAGMPARLIEDEHDLLLGTPP